MYAEVLPFYVIRGAAKSEGGSSDPEQALYGPHKTQRGQKRSSAAEKACVGLFLSVLRPKSVGQAQRFRWPAPENRHGPYPGKVEAQATGTSLLHRKLPHRGMSVSIRFVDRSGDAKSLPILTKTQV
jgi:hypothetical protein